MGRKDVRCNGMSFTECLGHGSQDVHVHIYTDGGRLGVWNISRQRGEHGLDVTRRVRECLVSLGYLLEGGAS